MLPKANRLVKPADFQRIYKQGTYFVARQMVIYCCPSSRESIRIGFVASKKVGKSVQRSRAKRLLRESMRSQLPFLAGGYDIVVIARPALSEDNYPRLAKVMAGLLRKAGLYRQENE